MCTIATVSLLTKVTVTQTPINYSTRRNNVVVVVCNIDMNSTTTKFITNDYDKRIFTLIKVIKSLTKMSRTYKI